MEQYKKLIEILIDPNATEAEKDDAAIDLGSFDEDEVEVNLLSLSNDLTVSELVRGSCGESLAEIWLRKGTLNINKLSSLTGIALFEAVGVIEGKNPKFIEEACKFTGHIT